MLSPKDKSREDKWSTGIAVGGEKFVAKIKELLGVKATGRRIVSMGGVSELREPSAPYNDDFMPENGRLSVENTYYWNNYNHSTDS